MLRRKLGNRRGGALAVLHSGRLWGSGRERVLLPIKATEKAQLLTRVKRLFADHKEDRSSGPMIPPLDWLRTPIGTEGDSERAPPLDEVPWRVAERVPSMRTRLALLVAATVVFAPGWQGDGSREPPRGSDLAARLLAPTVDEGAIRDAAADVKHQLDARQAKRGPNVTSATVAAFSFAATGLVILWVLASCRRRFSPLPALHAPLSRAPPHLQPA